jgi:hypothetical protein
MWELANACASLFVHNLASHPLTRRKENAEIGLRSVAPVALAAKSVRRRAQKQCFTSHLVQQKPTKLKPDGRITELHVLLRNSSDTFYPQRYMTCTTLAHA